MRKRSGELFSLSGVFFFVFVFPAGSAFCFMLTLRLEER
jgi:hypothetical protein